MLFALCLWLSLSNLYWAILILLIVAVQIFKLFVELMDAPKSIESPTQYGTTLEETTMNTWKVAAATHGEREQQPPECGKTHQQWTEICGHNVQASWCNGGKQRHQTYEAVAENRVQDVITVVSCPADSSASCQSEVSLLLPSVTYTTIKSLILFYF